MRHSVAIRLAIVCLMIGGLIGQYPFFSVGRTIQAAPRVGKQWVGSVQRIDQFAYDDIRLPKPLKRTDIFILPESVMAGQVWLDSDGDGVMDGLDAHPYEARVMLNPVYRVPFAGKEYVFRLSISPDYIEVFRTRMPHVLHENGDNISSFITKDDPFVAEIVAQAKAYKNDQPGLDTQGLLLAFAKNFPYNPDVYTGEIEYPKYPIETLIDQSGDCEDLAILAATLIGELHGYDRVAFVFFPEHMGIGIRTTDKEIAYREKNKIDSGHVQLGKDVYIYQETTDPVWVLGQIPDMYKKKNAIVYTVGS